MDIELGAEGVWCVVCVLCAGILSYEADPNVVDEVTGMAPLLYGVASGSVPVSIALVRGGASETSL